MEISKENISGIAALLEMTKMLCERLIKGKLKKPRLDDWEKDAVAGHKKMIGQCDITLKMLNNLKPVLIIELESESLPPPSAPASVIATETVCCDDCLEETTNPVKVGDESLCVVCNNEREAAEAAKKAEQEQAVQAAKKAAVHKRVAELQAEKDKSSTEISNAKIKTVANLKEQIKLLVSIGYENLDKQDRQRLTMFTKRLAAMEDGGSDASA
jgi:hypothetical protein